MMNIDYQNWALLIVRMVLGSTFIMHGSQKVLGWFGGPGLQGFASWVASLGVPAFMGYAAALCEFFGGLLVFFGIAAELGALCIIPVMIGAIVLVHAGHGYFIQNDGFEYALNLILLAIAVIIGGPGKYPLWDIFSIWR